MPSSRGRKNSEVQHGVKSIGCMSGIFYLLQGHRLDQKRLTQAAAKPDRILTSNTSQFKEIVTTHFSSNAEKHKKIRSKKPEHKSPAAPASDPRRLSCNNPRSPTLPPEMRRQSSETSGKEKLHRQPGVVARLMGLQDFPDAVVRRPDPQETTSEKRRRILGALEKCEEDLHTLKKIIEAIHVVEKCGRKPVVPVMAPPKVVVEMNLKGGGGSWMKAEHCKFPTSPTARSPLHGRRCIEPNSDQPSPVSVLDDSAFSSHDELTPVKNKEASQGTKETGSSNSFPTLKESDKYHRLVADAYAKPCEAAGAGDSSGGAPRKAPYVTAIEEGELTEVMKHSAKKERLELERIGMMLEAHVFGALLEETVSELGVSWRPASFMASLRCRKRLYF